MKKINNRLFWIFLVCLLVTNAQAHALWQLEDNEINRLNTQNAYAPSLALADTGASVTQYIAWHEEDVTGINWIYVKKWTGSTWAFIGSTLGQPYPLNNSVLVNADSASLAVADNTNDNLYAAWHEESNNGDIFVKKWTGSVWEHADGTYLDYNQAESASQPAMVLTRGSDQRPVIVWKEYNSSYGADHIVAKQLSTNDTWQNLTGTANGGDACLNVNSNNNAAYPSIAVDQNNRPCVVWEEDDGTGNSNLFVRRWNPDTIGWEMIGTTINAAAYDAYTPSIAVYQNNIYVAYHRTPKISGSDSIVVKHYVSGTTWEQVGSEINNNITPKKPKLIVQDDGTLAITWFEDHDGSGNMGVLVKQWTGSNWDTVGGVLNVSAAGSAVNPDIAGKGETLVTAWQEESESGTIMVHCKSWVTPTPTVTPTNTETITENNKGTPTPNPTAMNYVEDNNVIAYPVPASSIVHFAYKIPDQSGTVEIRIYNTGFRIVKILTADTASDSGQVSWDVSDIAPGIYFYRVRLGDKQLSVKRLVVAR